MKDEIKEILDNIKADLLYCYEDSYSTKEEYEKELDYITNLQYQLSATETNEETFRLEMLDITKCLGLDEDTIFDDVKEKATNLQEENRQTKLLKERYQLEKEDYKSRNEKAIEYIKKSMNNPQPFYEYLYGDEDGKVENLDKLLNILTGGDK